jgi:hypothetical protein
MMRAPPSRDSRPTKSAGDERKERRTIVETVIQRTDAKLRAT